MERRFGWVLEDKRRGPDTVCDVDLASDSRAAVVPSIGSLVPGWLLVVPRRPALAFAEFDLLERVELLTFALSVSAQVAEFGNRVYQLEHGAAVAGSSVGCGVDQAHLHVLPTDFDLEQVVFRDRSVQWTAADPHDPWRDVALGAEYYLIRSEDRCFIGSPLNAQRQYFRRKVAEAVGSPECWDYREWPFYERAGRTIGHYNHGARSQQAV